MRVRSNRCACFEFDTDDASPGRSETSHRDTRVLAVDSNVLGRSARERIALATVSLPMPAMSQQDIARLLADAHSIFVSGGYHCAHVLHHRLHLAGTLRASAHIYNDSADIEAFLAALREL